MSEFQQGSCGRWLAGTWESAFNVFRPVSSQEVEQRLKRVDIWKATGPDGIPASILHDNSAHLATSLAEIYNESLRLGVYPQKYKLANIFPVFKKGDRSQPEMYRPISLLPIASKVLERIVYDQLLQHLTASNSIPDEQFAYRAAHSCEDALAHCVNRWQRALDSNHVVAVALLDLSKAFDCVRHDQLLRELQSCGLGGVVLSWFSSYLSERYQQVTCPLQPSGNPYSANRGVPQGSVLGPLLFSVYIRELPSCISANSSTLLYADDTNVYTSHTSPDIATTRLETDLGHVANFLEVRGLRLNPTKTQFLLLRKPSVNACCQLTLCGTTISQTASGKYLDLVIDEHLTFRQQVEHIRSKVNAKVNAFRRCCSMLTPKAKRTFYLSYIQSTLEYSCNAYVHSLRQEDYNALRSISNRALRIVFGFPPTASVDLILSRQRITPLSVRYNVKLYILVYRCVHSLASPILCCTFSSLADSSTHTARATRSQQSLGL